MLVNPPLTNIPSRIFPQIPLDLTQDLSQFTLISILFTEELNWDFVTKFSIASNEIFAYMPGIISTAVQIDPSQVKTYCLQVYVPSTYEGNVNQLGTIYLAYIPIYQVAALAEEIKATQSPFYTAANPPVAKQLARLVNPSFNLESVPASSTGSNSGGSSSSSGSSKSSNTREDAIIGVVSALGGIAVVVLAFLIYRYVKRRQEIAHRRLSDPTPAGARPEGREFDQDSVGGARRRSFYYAEDSLRGFQGERQEDGQFDGRVNTSDMSQRRNVVPAAISAPILRESSMNW